jgi:hypothetical protein
MHAILPAILGNAHPTAVTLVSANFISPRLTLQRAQTSTRATRLGSDGTSWVEMLADQPRFAGTARRLMVEGQRSNLVANARSAGGTGWTNTGIASVVAATGPDGDAASANLITETAADSRHNLGSTSFNFTAGLPYSMSVLVAPGSCSDIQLLGGSPAFGVSVWQNFVLTGEGSLGSGGPAVTRASIRPFGAWYLCEMVGVAVATATTGKQICMTSGPTSVRSPIYVGTSRTVRVSWTWLEQAGFASSPILPPPGSPQASTRGADLVGATLGSLGLNAGAACTLLWSGVLPQAAPSGAAQTIIQIDDSTGNNAIRLRNAAGGSNLEIERTTAGLASSATLGSMTPGTPFRLGIAINGLGRAAASLQGGAAVAVTGSPAGGLTRLRLGMDEANGRAMFGQTTTLRLLPVALPDDRLATAVGSLPL